MFHLLPICVDVCLFVYQVLIIEGETGSGKTTQIPQYLYKAVSGHFNIVIT